jgi:anti-sigma-K factor RskA
VSTADDHVRYEDDLAAYMLDALPEDEAREMEQHIEGCSYCQERARWLQGSVEMLPTAVEQLEPPPELRERLMQTVRAEAAAAHAPPADRSERGRARRGWLDRLRTVPRPALALGATLVAIAGGVVGYALGNNGSGVDTTTLQAQAPAGARATLERDGDSGILRVAGLPQRKDRIYEVWIQRGKEVRPAGLFQVDRSGRGAAGIPNGLDDADRVMISAEPTGGSEQPTAEPVLILSI